MGKIGSGLFGPTVARQNLLNVIMAEFFKHATMSYHTHVLVIRSVLDTLISL
jgi:hypothetical protein